MEALRVALNVPDNLAERLIAIEARLDALKNWVPTATVTMPPIEIRWVSAPVSASRSPVIRGGGGGGGGAPVHRTPVLLHQFKGQTGYNSERCLYIANGSMCDTARNARKGDHLCANHRHYLNTNPARIQTFVSDMDLSAVRLGIPDDLRRSWMDAWAADHAADAAAAAEQPKAQPNANVAQPVVVVPSSVIEAAVPEPEPEPVAAPTEPEPAHRLPNARRRRPANDATPAVPVATRRRTEEPAAVTVEEVDYSVD